MSDDVNTPDETENGPDELTLLKQRADTMGMKYHPAIGVDALKAKINEALAGTPPQDQTTDQGQEAPAREPSAAEKRLALRNEIRGKALALVRVRVANMNPAKNDLEGEIFTVANKYIGEVKKYIPYGEATDAGYHIPMCIYNLLKTKKFLQLRTVKSQTLGKPDAVKQRWVQEFNIEVLEPLTKEELADLARVQASRADVDD